MRALRLDEFTTLEGQPFELVLGEHRMEFTLAGVRQLPDSGRDGGAFVLDWLGPADPVLPQDIYTFRQGDGEYEMFIVPTGRDPNGAQYEAVFN
jgi:hypothetical protein